MRTKTILISAIGALLLVAMVVLWGAFAGRITSLLEAGLCRVASDAADCQLRGSNIFVIWTVVALVLLIVFGLIIERFNRPR
jgi:hypothetical protein